MLLSTDLIICERFPVTFFLTDIVAKHLFTKFRDFTIIVVTFYYLRVVVSVYSLCLCGNPDRDSGYRRENVPSSIIGKLNGFFPYERFLYKLFQIR